MRAAECCEVHRELVGRPYVGKRFQRGSHVVAELAAVHIKRRPAVSRNGRKSQHQRRVRHVGAADVEGPGECTRIGHDDCVRFEPCELGAHTRELCIGRLARKAQVVQADRPERNRRAVAPDRIERRCRHKLATGGFARLRELFGAADRMQPRIVGERRAGREIGLDPRFRRRLGDVLDREQILIDLIAGLQRVAPVDE